MTRFTHPRLQGIAGYLDAVRAEWSVLVHATPRAALLALPGDGRWSGAQIIQHLGKVEGATAKALEGVFAAALARGLGADASAGSVLGSLDRLQVPEGALRPLVAPERVAPSADADLDASWASLTAVRERTYRAFAGVDGRDLTQVSVPHPFFGPFNGYEWLLFLGKHEERHLAQVKRQLGLESS
jgi:hypothetical protein